MHILYLAQLVPYPTDAGPKVRMYYVLRYLASAGHEVTLLAFSRETDTVAGVEYLREFCAEVYTVPMIRSRVRDAYHLARSLLSDHPFLIARDDVANMKAKAIQLAQGRSFDAIHADQLWMASYALATAGSVSPRPRLILDQHNAMYLVPQRLAGSSAGLQRALLEREAAVMRLYEQDTCRGFDSVVWVTAEDQAAAGIDHRGDGLPRQQVIPICVDPAAQPELDHIPAAHRVTFLGGLHWPPNADGIRWFVREVWPLVRAQCPEAVLTVIGRNPPRELSTIESCEVTGYVDNPAPVLRETSVFIVPLLAGGGMRVKILEAWCWGLPVVSTSIGAEGIGYTDGEDILIANESGDFATRVISVWRDRSLAEALAQGGRATVEQHYDWRKVYPQWNHVYAPLAATVPPSV